MKGPATKVKAVTLFDNDSTGKPRPYRDPRDGSGPCTPDGSVHGPFSMPWGARIAQSLIKGGGRGGGVEMPGGKRVLKGTEAPKGRDVGDQEEEEASRHYDHKLLEEKTAHLKRVCELHCQSSLSVNSCVAI